jgi:hypothetical protein
MNLPQGLHYGLIAQDVQKVLPNLVKNSKFETELATEPVLPSGKEGIKSTTAKSETIDFKAVNYTELIPVLIKGMQEQQQRIEDQQQKITQLSQQLSELLKEKGINSSLSNIILEQNSPNPYNHSTGIRYGIPAGFRTAELVITDITGKRIRQIKLSSGSGTVNLDASLLSSGAYSYSLVIDGKIADTKKMVVAK